jgi:two-component system response regulator YesN
MSEHYDDPLTLREAARIAALEPTYFSRLFNQQTGVCFRDWLRMVRVSGALPLLREGQLTITQIAFKVGFTGLRGLERACLQFVGACPRSLRFEIRSENTTSVATNGEDAR